MSDGFINIGTKIDETGLDKGLKNVDDKLKKTEKTTKSTAKSFANLGLKVAGVAASVKIAADIVGDLTDAYKTQIKAETQLEAAAKNNPFLDSSSVNSLKDYASELSAVSGIADQEIIPQMAKLAAAGRTNDEIMSILSASVDMAASGAFSLDSAVGTLNKSFGGLSGELGESIPEIKTMTAEQLTQGGAVKLLADRYKGIAAEVKATTGAGESLKTSWRDLKEELGAPFTKAMNPVQVFFSGLISGWANSLKAKREYQKVSEANAAAETRTSGTLQKQLVTEKNKLAEMKKQVAEEEGALTTVLAGKGMLAEEARKEARKRIASWKLEIQDQEKNIQLLSTELKIQKDIETEKNSAGSTDDQKALDYITKNTAAREKSLETLKLQAATENRQVTAGEKLSVYVQSYIDLISESEGKVTETNQAAVSLLNTTKEIAKEAGNDIDAKEKAVELEKQLKEALDSIEAADPRKESEKMADQLAMLDDYYTQVKNNANISAKDKEKIEKEYLAKRKILLGLEGEAVKDEAKQEYQDHIKKATDILTIANNFATQYASIATTLSALITQQAEDEAKIKTAALEDQYSKGEISTEEYEKKLVKIKKDAAQKKYEMDMWVWGSQILSAVANTALGVTQALATEGPIGIITGALVGLAGAAQLTAIIANKPIPPSFATGGVVPGTSFVGDKVTANVNSAERILTAQQNAAFERLAYGKGGSGDIKVYNSVSNEVTAKPQITEDGIKIMIEKTVNSQMADGRFNKSYRTMQNNLRGTRYTN